jgi:hypothetical protein
VGNVFSELGLCRDSLTILWRYLRRLSAMFFELNRFFILEAYDNDVSSVVCKWKFQVFSGGRSVGGDS